MTNSLVRFAGAGASVAMLMMVGCTTETVTAPPAKETNSATITTDPFAITKSIYCGGRLQDTPLYFSYDVDLFANGNIFASAAIIDAGGSSSYSNFYAPTQKGAQTASVIVSRDQLGKSNGGWWELSLDRETLVTSIVNHDSDLASGTQTWTMVSTDCVANTY